METKATTVMIVSEIAELWDLTNICYVHIKMYKLLLLFIVVAAPPNVYLSQKSLGNTHFYLLCVFRGKFVMICMSICCGI